MRITYINRRFLDYRIPVLRELNRLSGNRLSVIYSTDAIPARVDTKLKELLNERAIGVTGEIKYGRADRETMANSHITLRFSAATYTKLVGTKPDVMIGEGFFKWTIAGIFHRILSNTPLVVCYERTGHTERTVQWYRELYRRSVLPLVSCICCNGELSSKYVQSLGFSPTRITVGHMAADIEGLSVQIERIKENHIQSLKTNMGIEGVVFLYVGQLIARKGVRQLIEAWREFEFLTKTPCCLVLVGNGNEARGLKKYIQENRMRTVRFIGPVDYDAIGRWYAVADVLVIPTLEDNWSLVVPEAMACGLPILTSIYNGCWPELVRPGENGWIFDPLNLEDMLSVLSRCIENGGRLKQMGKISKSIVENFSPENAAKVIYNSCKIALGGLAGKNPIEPGDINTVKTAYENNRPPHR